MKSSKEKAELESLYHRLDEVRMSQYERISAKAHLERADAIAELLIAAGATIGRACRALIVRPIRRVFANVG